MPPADSRHLQWACHEEGVSGTIQRTRCPTEHESAWLRDIRIPYGSRQRRWCPSLVSGGRGIGNQYHGECHRDATEHPRAFPDSVIRIDQWSQQPAAEPIPAWRPWVCPYGRTEAYPRANQRNAGRCGGSPWLLQPFRKRRDRDSPLCHQRTEEIPAPKYRLPVCRRQRFLCR